MARFARWRFLHRRVVLAAWVIALIGFLAVGRLAGSAYTDSASLPRTDSNQAQTVLQSNFPTQSGDVDQIVVHAKHGTLRSTAVEAAVTNLFAKVGRLPMCARSPLRTARSDRSVLMARSGSPRSPSTLSPRTSQNRR